MVRHAESPFTPDQEEERGLSEKGWADARKVADRLKHEQIDVFISSHYARAVQTIEEAARQQNKTIMTDARLRERELASWDYPFDDFEQGIKHVFDNPDFAYPGGESNELARKRGIAALAEVLQHHRGKKVAIGTHGNIMTLMMNHYDKQYHFAFWKQTTKPDIYKLSFEDDTLVHVERLWEE
ncbi:histidine phosphatase family protein [Brevibacillus reuszeri]|uniref:histidine phosphatase family protein n=1 Tax=Brevibacillus reuszeri TaxID=54915 RepID=UPI0028A1442C|nr:histidine phosphatase family protein [Brevibacillus reuszeri]